MQAFIVFALPTSSAKQIPESTATRTVVYMWRNASATERSHVPAVDGIYGDGNNDHQEQCGHMLSFFYFRIAHFCAEW